MDNLQQAGANSLQESSPLDMVLSGKASPATLLTQQEAQSAKPAASDTNKSEQPANATESPEGKAHEEAVEKALESKVFASESSEEKLSRLERDSKASQKEAMRLKTKADKLLELLEGQGLEIAEEDGKPVGLVPGKGYTKDGKPFSLKAKDLSEEELAMFDEPQKAIDFVMRKAREALVRAAPTMEPSQRPISAERKDMAFQFVKGIKSEISDAVLHPNIEKNRPYIERMVTGPQAIKGVKEFFNQNPEFALQVLDRHIDSLRTSALESAKKVIEKKSEKTISPPIGPTSGTTPDSSAAWDWATEQAKAIANAR